MRLNLISKAGKIFFTALIIGIGEGMGQVVGKEIGEEGIKKWKSLGGNAPTPKYPHKPPSNL